MHELTAQHLENLLPRLRASDRAEILSGSRYQSLEDWARSRVAAPGVAWAVEERGQVIAAGGVMEGAVRGIGTIWLVGSDQLGCAAKHILRLWRVIRNHGGYRRLEGKCMASNAVANRFAQRMGLVLEGTLRGYTLTGEDVNQYGLVMEARNGR